MNATLLCYLHNDGDPDHWIDRVDAVGVHPVNCGVILFNRQPVPAARTCVVVNEIDPARVVGPWSGRKP